MHQIKAAGLRFGDREPPRIGGIRIIAADTLKVVALKVELLSLAQPGFGQARMLPQVAASQVFGDDEP